MYSPTSFNDRSYSVAGGEPLESLNLQQMYDLKEPEYLIAGLMIDGGVYSVVAPPGIGKSWVEQRIALTVAYETGGAWRYFVISSPDGLSGWVRKITVPSAATSVATIAGCD